MLVFFSFFPSLLRHSQFDKTLHTDKVFIHLNSSNYYSIISCKKKKLLYFTKVLKPDRTGPYGPTGKPRTIYFCNQESLVQKKQGSMRTVVGSYGSENCDQIVFHGSLLPFESELRNKKKKKHFLQAYRSRSPLL